MGVSMQVQGNTKIVKLLQQLQPSVIIPLLNANFPMTGPFASLVYEEGKADQLTQRLQQAKLSKTKVRMPAPVPEALQLAFP